MTKITSVINRHCKKCNSYKKFKLSIVKSKSPSSNSASSRRRAKCVGRGPSGKYGKVPAKSTKICKKFNILMTCETCLHKRNLIRPRSKKLAIK